MVNVKRIEFSHDGVTFTETFSNNQYITTIIEEDSIVTDEGFSYGDTPTIATLTLRYAGTNAQVAEMLSYKHMRVYVNNVLVFSGYNPSNDEEVISSEYRQGSATYSSYASYFETVTFESDIYYSQPDGIKVCDPQDTSHSLVHIIANMLFETAPQAFTLECSYRDTTVVPTFTASIGDSIYNVLCELLEQAGLTFYIKSYTLYVIDMLEEPSGVASNIIDFESGMQLSEKAYESKTLPMIRTCSYHTVTDITIGTQFTKEQKIVVNPHASIEAPVSLKYDAGDNTEVVLYTPTDVSLVGATEGIISGYGVVLRSWEKTASNQITAQVYNEHAIFNYSYRNIKVTGNVIYLDYNNLVVPQFSDTNMSFTVQRNEEKTNYLSSTSQALRYLRALLYGKYMDAKTYTVYTTVNLNLNDFCTIHGESGYYRVIQKQCAYDHFGGYTYTVAAIYNDAGLHYSASYVAPVADLPAVSPGIVLEASRYTVEYDPNGRLLSNIPIRITLRSLNTFLNPTLRINGEAVTPALAPSDSGTTDETTVGDSGWYYDVDPHYFDTHNEMTVSADINYSNYIAIRIIRTSLQPVKIIQQYYVSTSTEEPSGGTWLNTKPLTYDGYLWRRTGTVYTDGSIVYEEPYYILAPRDISYTSVVEYAVSSSSETFVFPDAVIGYSEDTLGADDFEFGFKNYVWSSDIGDWYKGLYVWTRTVITDANGNVTYGEPIYCKTLTESLIQSCSLEVITNPKAFSISPRLVGYQYIPVSVIAIGYSGTMSLRIKETNTDAVFCVFDTQTEQYVSVGNVVTGLSVDNPAVYTDYVLRLPYTLSPSQNITLEAVLVEWDSTEISPHIVEASMVLAGTKTNTSVVQLDNVPTKEDLPEHLNFTDSIQEDIISGNNLIYGDYIIVEYYQIAPSEGLYPEAYDPTKKYYLRTVVGQTVVMVEATISGDFDGTTTYYRYAPHPYMHVGEGNWVSEDRLVKPYVKVNTVQQVVSLAKAKHDTDPSIDYHECLYAYEAYIDTLTVGILNVGNVFARDIQSVEYAEDANGTPTLGYKLEYEGGDLHNGQVKSYGGVFADMKVRGNMDLRIPDGNGGYKAGAQILHPTLTTVPSVPGDPTGVMLPSTGLKWSFRELYEAPLAENEVIDATNSSALGNTIYKVVKLTNAFETMYESETGSSAELGNGENTYTVFTPTHGGTITLKGRAPRRQTQIYGSPQTSCKLTFKDTAGTVLAEVPSKSSGSGDVDASFEVSFYISKGTTIRCTTSHVDGVSSTINGYCIGSVSAQTFQENRLSEVGLWMHHSNGLYHPSSWSRYDIAKAYSPTEGGYDITVAGFHYQSSSYMNLRPMANFTGYASYTYTQSDVQHTGYVNIGDTYKLDSSLTSIAVRGVSVTATYFRRNTTTNATLIFANGDSITFNSDDYLYITGKIAVAETEEGVEMKGQYPVMTDTYDLGTSSKQWRAGYIKNLFSDIVQVGSPNLQYDGTNDYQGSITLTNGLILKYGIYGNASTGATSRCTAISYRQYPQAVFQPFPHQTLAVFANIGIPASDDVSQWNLAGSQVVIPYNVTKDGFKVGAGFGGGNAGYALDYCDRPFYWFAIGY